MSTSTIIINANHAAMSGRQALNIAVQGNRHVNTQGIKCIEKPEQAAKACLIGWRDWWGWAVDEVQKHASQEIHKDHSYQAP